MDAGSPTIEVINGNKTWVKSFLLAPISVDDTLAFSVNVMSLKTTLQRRSITLKGKEEDWASIKPIFSVPYYKQPEPPSGSSIAGGSLCKDDKNLYIRIDFANGKPDLTFACARLLSMIQAQEVHLQVVRSESDRSAHTEMWVSGEKRSYEIGRYSVGVSFIEMQFPLSSITKYFDVTKPIDAQLAFWPTKAVQYTNQTLWRKIIIGK